ncbi:MAG: 4Fe-4S binding protein [Chloroflexi bacterium]|nr:4Fe-4S binding protein [Chloroflexota bacterium]
MQKNFWQTRSRHILIILAVLSLVGALIFGQVTGGKTDVYEYLPDIIPAGSTATLIAEEPVQGNYVYRVDLNGDLYGYVTFGEGKGYNGTMVVMTLWSADGVVLDIQVPKQVETPSYYVQLEQQGHFQMYIGKVYNSDFILGNGVDATSGSTRSSEGVNTGFLNGLYLMSDKVPDFAGVAKPDKPIVWQTVPVIGLVVLLIFVFIIRMIPALSKITVLRYLTLFGGLIVLGFIASAPLSLANFAAWAVGFVPDISTNIYIYILVFSVVGLAVIFGKNFYCYWICPFNAIQEGTHFLGASKVRPVTKRQLALRNVRYFVLWAALMITFIMRNPSFAVFEPWATLFHWDAGTISTWLLVAATIGTSVFIYNFWCHYLCPVGAVMDVVLNIRKWFVGLFRKTV